MLKLNNNRKFILQALDEGFVIKSDRFGSWKFVGNKPEYKVSLKNSDTSALFRANLVENSDIMQLTDTGKVLLKISK